MTRARHGRPRKPGARFPSGDISRAMPTPAILPETIARRRDLAPGVSDNDLRSGDYGSPIALLAARGVISEAQKDAALTAERIYARWRFMAGAPPRHLSDRGGSAVASEPDEQAWARAKSAFAALEVSLARGGILGRTTVESIVFDGWYPAIWFESSGRINAGYGKAQAAFKAALDAVIKDFGLEGKNPLAA